MHGQKREEYKARFSNPEIAAKLEKKALQWNSLFSELLSRRGNLSSSSEVKIDIPKPSSLLHFEEADNDMRALQKDGSKQNSDGTIKPKLQPYLEITLALNSKLLLVNPDPLVLWNIRRELLLKSSSDKDTSDLFDLQIELKVTTQCLERNPKAYGIWLHRKWTLQHYLRKYCSQHDESNSINILQYELHLCKEFLNLDERNFHCWNYRRFVVSVMGVLEQSKRCGDVSMKNLIIDGSWEWLQKDMDTLIDSVVMGPQMVHPTINQSFALSSISTNSSGSKISPILRTEWEYTTLKIQANFSNYSAFHYRSKLLPLLVQQDVDQMKINENETIPWYDIYNQKLQYAQDELELIHQAIFTEPDDQTAWWYHRFILDSFLSPPSMEQNEDEDNEGNLENLQSLYIELLQSELEQLQELIEIEDGNCKWGLLATHMTYGKLRIVMVEDDEAYKQEQWNCLDTLMEIDPDRKKRYESMKK